VRRLLRPSLVLLGTATALLGGGGVLAFAGWTSRSTSPTFTITAAGIPQPQRPTVTRVIFPVIAWKRVRISPDTPVHRYVVTRHLGSTERIVCSQAATSRTICVDVTAPPDTPVTYTVHATHGEHWTGVESAPSLPLGAAPAVAASGAPAPSASVPVTPGPSAPSEPADPTAAETAPTGATMPSGPVPPTTEPPTPLVFPSTSAVAVTENLVPSRSP
jgi:hypothetical protein